MDIDKWEEISAGQLSPPGVVKVYKQGVRNPYVRVYGDTDVRVVVYGERFDDERIEAATLTSLEDAKRLAETMGVLLSGRIR